jgi:hypothetical protein
MEVNKPKSVDFSTITWFWTLNIKWKLLGRLFKQKHVQKSHIGSSVTEN